MSNLTDYIFNKQNKEMPFPPGNHDWDYYISQELNGVPIKYTNCKKCNIRIDIINGQWMQQTTQKLPSKNCP